MDNCLTSVVFALQGGVQVFRRTSKSSLSTSTAQGNTIVSFSLLDWARLMPQHVHQSSNNINGRSKEERNSYKITDMLV